MTESLTSLALLTQQLEQLKQLDALLNVELDVLQKHLPDALVEVTEQKNTLLLAIQTLDQTISQKPEFSEDKQSEPCRSLLLEIEAALADCQKQNQINGQVIQHSQLAVERMKTSLLESHNKSAVTYDNKGKKSGGLSSIGIKA